MVRIGVDETYDLGEEFFRWEIATAVAGAVIGIHPFDQPDVEASKVATRLTSEYEKTGKLPPETPFFEGKAVSNSSPTSERAGPQERRERVARLGLSQGSPDRIKVGDYVALLAYLEMNQAHEQRCKPCGHRVRDRKRVATCLGFGPRFLHSTGQAYKGGPNTGVFLQVTCDDARTCRSRPEYTFGIVKASQARGDFQVLADRAAGPRVHLGPMWRRACGAECRHRKVSGVAREAVMQLGMIGLGRMGANMVRRLMQGGHSCVVFDRSRRRWSRS